MTIKIKSTDPITPGEVHLQPVPADEMLATGSLWEPGLISGNKAVKLNTSHEYYEKVYYPNIERSPVTVEAIDYLIYSLGMAELDALSEEYKDTLEDIRIEVSKLLRILTRNLPDLPVEDSHD